MLRVALSTFLLASLMMPVVADALDLSKPDDNLRAYLKMRGSLDGKDVVTWWSGQVFAAIPDERPKLLFGFEGMNVARMEQLEDGSWRMLSREYAVYKDPKTGEILQQWHNPWTGATLKVFDVQNDPVNQQLGGGPREDDGPPRLLPLRQMGDDVILGFDVPLAYPNPIQPDLYPESSTGPVYVGSEHFGFYARKAELDDEAISSAPISIAWFREGPWLPWMKMGDHAGLLIYSGYGKKLLGGVDELPQPFHDYLKQQAPEFLAAPREWSQPNATTWTVYRQKVLEAESATDQSDSGKGE
ncbi:MAG: DUF1838 family protein [Xanthomonadales bacterium]|nr:DUF1838 family protein [Xanthomonadales bacterium]